MEKKVNIIEQPDEQYYTFDEQLEHAREGYLQNINDYQE
tara:strand:- start:562 stop:678 length:117 start_codon:yes stop_codon:yes gene_type:complete